MSEPSAQSRPISTYKSWQIHRFDQIDSTSSWIKSNQENLSDYSVAVAEFQTAGRGRLGRQWVAPKGTALMFSMLLRPNWPIDKASWLMMIAGLAAAETLSELGKTDIQLKWPNDIVIMKSNQMYKMGGILSEAITEDGILTGAIIGIGININMTDDQLPQDANTAPCSLRSITGKRFDLNSILPVILDRFDSYYQTAAVGESPQKHWEKKLVTLGQPVTATVIGSKDQATKIDGIAVGVDEWARLLIKTKEGKIEPVTAGDVTLRTS
ncbi:MAG: biotin--[acetyl-CoA-carboxylase] ligase [Anaerolineae bacterium]